MSFAIVDPASVRLEHAVDIEAKASSFDILLLDLAQRAHL